MKPSKLIYRVWDKNHNEYINRTGEENGHLQNSLKVGIYGIDDTFADVELYTGFKDTNGTPIFDGDIVNVEKYYYTGFPEKLVVTMLEGEWIFKRDGDLFGNSISEVLRDKNVTKVIVTDNVHEREVRESEAAREEEYE